MENHHEDAGDDAFAFTSRERYIIIGEIGRMRDLPFGSAIEIIDRLFGGIIFPPAEGKESRPARREPVPARTLGRLICQVSGITGMADGERRVLMAKLAMAGAGTVWGPCGSPDPFPRPDNPPASFPGLHGNRARERHPRGRETIRDTCRHTAEKRPALPGKRSPEKEWVHVQSTAGRPDSPGEGDRAPDPGKAATTRDKEPCSPGGTKSDPFWDLVAEEVERILRGDDTREGDGERWQLFGGGEMFHEGTKKAKYHGVQGTIPGTTGSREREGRGQGKQGGMRADDLANNL